MTAESITRGWPWDRDLARLTALDVERRRSNRRRGRTNPRRLDALRSRFTGHRAVTQDTDGSG
jgi:hypothetical protein